MMNNEQMIADITKAVLAKLDSNSNKTMGIPVGVSARHVHVSKEDLYTLFGEGYELTPYKELMGGQYAAKECVTIIGTKLRAIENVRILGPVRPKSQVEVSGTDCIRLGVRAPIRASGDTKDSAPITLVGPKGAINLNEGCIRALRHIHMPPDAAEELGVVDKQIVDVKILGERGGVFSEVLVRIHHSFRLEMHVDTDEANAMGINCGDKVMIHQER